MSRKVNSVIEVNHVMTPDDRLDVMRSFYQSAGARAGARAGAESVWGGEVRRAHCQARAAGRPLLTGHIFAIQCWLSIFLAQAMTHLLHLTRILSIKFHIIRAQRLRRTLYVAKACAVRKQSST